jgi:ArsR family transcriptional regulator
MRHSYQYIIEQAKIFKALGHPSRLLMVDALRDGEKCVCELQALLNNDMSTVSKHLSILREAGIVSSDKRGTNIYYRLSLCCLENFLSCTGDLIEQKAISQLSIWKTS